MEEYFHGVILDCTSRLQQVRAMPALLIEMNRNIAAFFVSNLIPKVGFDKEE